MTLLRRLALLLACLSIGNLSSAQVSTGYTFSAANASVGGNLTGGTLLASGGGIGSATDDAVFSNQPIGFNFKFNGVSYTTVGVSTNGFIWFGNPSPAANEYNPISSTAAYAGAVAVYGRDLTGMAAGSELRIQTQGTAPNRTFTVNWKRFVATDIFATTENRMDAWVVLHECTGIIETAISANQYQWGFEETFGQVGLRGAANADFFNRVVDCDLSVDWLSSTPGTSNSDLANMGTTVDFAQCWPGTYTFGGGGTPTVFTFTPTIVNLPVLTCTNPSPLCNGASGNVAVNVSGGTAPYNLDWTFGGAASPSPTTGTLANATFPNSTAISTTFANAGSGTYSVSVTDGAGCQSTCSGTVTVNACNTNTITTGTIAGSPFCPGSSVTVPFTSTGTFNAGNVYTAQLSDASGSFASPTNIGTLNSTANTGNVSATIPSSTPAGSGYRIRVISSNPAVNGTDNGVDLVVSASVTASVGVSASSTNICAGGSVTFTATPTNGGSSPTYQWQVNNVNAGTNSPTFTTTSLNDGDVVTVIMTSDAACVSGSPATSNTTTIAVATSGTAAVSIAANNNPICSGSNATFTATPVNGGSAPSYQWQLNGSNVGTDNAAYTATGLADGDQISVTMTSNSACVSNPTVSSNVVTITVTPSVPASVQASASQTSICAGTAVTFTANPVNGGPSPTYQWHVNGVNVGNNSVTYSSSTLSDGDVITVTMTSNATCVTGSPAPSNALTMTVSPTLTPQVSITPDHVEICQGTPVTFTAVALDAGSTPTYQWFVNGTTVGTDASFVGAALQNNDAISVAVTASGGCFNPTSVASNAVVATVNAPVPVSISPRNAAVCFQTPVTFTATGAAGNFNWTSSDSSVQCDGCSSVTLLPLQNTVVMVTSGSGSCTTFDTAYATLSCDMLWLPNAFTPNGDGLNDVLRVLGTDLATLDFRIYNRWGQSVFVSTNPDLGWDGRYNGQPAPMGTYSWTLKATNAAGKQMSINGKNAGNVTLIR